MVQDKQATISSAMDHYVTRPKSNEFENLCFDVLSNTTEGRHSLSPRLHFQMIWKSMKFTAQYGQLVIKI